MLSDGDIQNALNTAMEDQSSKSRPSTLNFFSHDAPNDAQQPITVAIHKWAISDIEDDDTLKTIKGLARIIVKEVASVALSLTGEMVFGVSKLLPHQPVWSDGATLFAGHSADGEVRFGVPGGNIVESVGSLADDVANAIDRLVELDSDGSYDSEACLRIFCAKPLERRLMRACAKIGVTARVLGMRDYKSDEHWVVSRDDWSCSMLMQEPDFSLPVKGNKLIAGAKYVVWINDPRLVVCVTTKEQA